VNEREAVWTELMRAANAGDETAYDRLLRSLAPSLRAGARRGLARAGVTDIDAEDVVQEILIAVHLKRRTWKESEPIGPWIWAIARYKLVDALRRRGRRVHLPIEDFDDRLIAQEPETNADRRDVERHLGNLPARQREVIRSVALDGASIGQTAERLGMSSGAVRVALHRAVRALAPVFRQ
jgi:RNA polymerase sigma-70 factor (ECF subfamily)